MKDITIVEKISQISKTMSVSYMNWLRTTYLGNNNALSERRNNDKFSTLNRIMNSKESKFSYDKAMIQKEMESKNESTKNTNFNVIGKLVYKNL